MTRGKCSDILLAKGWPASRVRMCLRSRDRAGLVRFLRERHCERFFEPIRRIAKARGNEQGFGFSVMALCSLLVRQSSVTVMAYRQRIDAS